MTALEIAEPLAAAPASAVADVPRFVRRLLRRPLAVICLAYLLGVVAVAIVAPIALPRVRTEFAGDFLAVRQGPSAEHPLGTDTLGRDVLDRLLVGARVTMVGVAQAMLVLLALGIPLGLVAGYFRGRTDRIVGWFGDLTFSMPAIVIIIIVFSVFPNSMTAGMITLGILAAPGLMRVVRSATLPVREELYVAAAQVSGLSRPYIISRHIAPRIAGAVIVQASLLAAAVLLIQSGLAFLNLVVAPPEPSWGGMVADGLTVIEQQPWLIIPPGLTIAVTVLAFSLLGDAVRDATTESWAAATRPARVRRARTRSAPNPSTNGNPAGAPRALLSIRHLTVSVRTGSTPRTLLDDVSFDVLPGETLGLVGESGCGKTMTAMSILRLLPAGIGIDEGRIVFDAVNLVELPEGDLRRIRGRQIAFVSQEPMVSLNPAFRVGWQIAEAVNRNRGLSGRRARAEAVELLRRVHLPNAEAVARKYPHELSGGMAQRVALARALAGNPRLLIADEPTTALDVTVQAEIIELLRELQQGSHMAVLLVTHNWGVVADICDRVVVMYAGQVVERAPVLTIFDRPSHPYTAALLASNPQKLERVATLPMIPGTVPQPGNWPAGCRFRPRCAHARDKCAQPIPLEHPEPARAVRCIRHDELVNA